MQAIGVLVALTLVGNSAAQITQGFTVSRGQYTSATDAKFAKGTTLTAAGSMTTTGNYICWTTHSSAAPSTCAAADGTGVVPNLVTTNTQVCLRWSQYSHGHHSTCSAAPFIHRV